MPYRKTEFADDEIYHITIRSIDDNLLFKNADDYFRGIFSIYEFNDTKPVNIRQRRRIRLQIKRLLKESPKNSSLEKDRRDKMVGILAFCFMPNHIHLLLRQLKKSGITKLMIKVGGGYGGYFNRKYNREGHVFRSRFRTVHIATDSQLITVFNYIHTNPLSLIEPEWKNGKIKNRAKANAFLKSYKWSSYRDYIGKTGFPSITERAFFIEMIGNKKDCQRSVENWIKYKKGELTEATEARPLSVDRGRASAGLFE